MTWSIGRQQSVEVVLYIAIAFILLGLLLVVGVVRHLGNQACLADHAVPIHDRFVPEDRASALLEELEKCAASSMGGEVADRPPGSGACSLSDADQAFQARLHLADWAQQTLDVQYYGFQNDEAGQRLLAALLAAADRGVRVQLLLDDIDLAHSDTLLARLSQEHENIEIRVFNPLWLRRFRPLDFLLRFPRSSRRMHNKSLTADAQVSIVGGRNIGDDYFRLGDEVSFTDFDVLIFGQVANAVSGYFDNYWQSRVAVDIGDVAQAADDARYEKWLASIRATASHEYLEDESDDDRASEPKGDGHDDSVRSVDSDERLRRFLMQARGGSDLHGCRGSVHADPPEKVLGRLFDTDGSLTPVVREQLMAAEHSVVICSPYFIPYEQGMAVFEELRGRGVDVTVLTNSYASNDVLAVHAGYVDYRERMLALGVKMHEFKPGHAGGRHHKLLGNRRSSLHAKAFVIDDRRLFVGSFNLDPRSAIHNTELGIVLESESLAGTLSHSLTDRLDEIAYHLQSDEQHRLRWRERDDQGGITWHESEPHTTALSRSGVYLLSWLPVEWLL